MMTQGEIRDIWCLSLNRDSDHGPCGAAVGGVGVCLDTEYEWRAFVAISLVLAGTGERFNRPLRFITTCTSSSSGRHTWGAQTSAAQHSTAELGELGNQSVQFVIRHAGLHCRLAVWSVGGHPAPPVTCAEPNQTRPCPAPPTHPCGTRPGDWCLATPD